MTQPDTLARLRYVAKNRTSRYGIPISELGALLDIAEAAQEACKHLGSQRPEIAALERALAALDAADSGEAGTSCHTQVSK